MSITRNIKPLLARLAKAKPEIEYSTNNQYGEEVDFTKQEYDAAEKLFAFDEDVANVDDFGETTEVGDESLFVVQEDALKDLRKLLANPTTIYQLSGADGIVNVSADEYAKMGRKKVYTFSVHGFDAMLSADTLAIGCQDHTLDYWAQQIEGIAIRYMGNFGSNNVSDLVERQFREALPVLTKLQAKLAKPVAKKKAKAKKAKTGR